MEKEKDEFKEAIDKLTEQAKDDLVLNKMNVLEEAQANCVKYHRYISMLYTEKRYLSKLEEMKSELHGKLYHKYRFEYNHKLAKGPEIAIYINKEPKMLLVQKNINNVSLKIEYINGIIDTFKQRSFMIKNIIDILKLEQEGFF